MDLPGDVHVGGAGRRAVTALDAVLGDPDAARAQAVHDPEDRAVGAGVGAEALGAEPPDDQEQPGDNQAQLEQSGVDGADCKPTRCHAAIPAIPKIEHPIERQVPDHRQRAEHQAQRARDFDRQSQNPAPHHGKQGDRNGFEQKRVAEAVGEASQGRGFRR